MEQKMRVRWRDSGKEPQCAPDPSYPDGIDLDVSDGAEKTCKVALPYPAKRIGSYVVECPMCGARTACTTAGRADDPKSIKVACRKGNAANGG